MKKIKQTRKALSKHVINLYSAGNFQVVKIRNILKMQEDIENDLFIRDETANVGCHLSVLLVIFLCMFQLLPI